MGKVLRAAALEDAFWLKGREGSDNEKFYDLGSKIRGGNSDATWNDEGLELRWLHSAKRVRRYHRAWGRSICCRSDGRKGGTPAKAVRIVGAIASRIVNVAAKKCVVVHSKIKLRSDFAATSASGCISEEERDAGIVAALSA